MGTESQMVPLGVRGHAIEIALEPIEVHQRNRCLVYHTSMIYQGRNGCKRAAALVCLGVEFWF